MSELATSEEQAPRGGASTVDPEAIVIAIPRRGGLPISGAIRTIEGGRASEIDLEDTEPVLAD